MLLATYKTVRPGVQGLVNLLIMLRLRSKRSHTEVVFEPGDGVDSYMQDGTCAPDAKGALWAASTVAWERLPAWSPVRAGKRGGTRFKRIAFDPANWELQPYPRDPMKAVEVFKRREGKPYGWRLILGFVGWLLTLIWPPSKDQTICSTISAEAGGYEEPNRYDPAVLHVTVASENKAREVGR